MTVMVMVMVTVTMTTTLRSEVWVEAVGCLLTPVRNNVLTMMLLGKQLHCKR